MRLNESRTRPFQAPATVHTFPGRQLFVFPNGRSDSDESSEEELNVMELRPRGKEQPRSSSRDRLGDVVLLERELTQEDSLNKLALQYGCKVADIKRVNNFIREQDLYALKSIKIPVRPHGLLTESAGALRPPAAGPAQPGLTRLEPPEPEPEPSAGGSPVPEAGKRDAGSGADCGIQWWNAVFIMLLIGIVLPVFYIIYFKTQGLAAHTFNITTPNVSTAALEGKLTQGPGVGKKT
ncbi:PREDICTED: lysM and putative peptidoglycan-binding domain-containing protein 4 [Ficedula albicollis]|uniref:lysM and putative peptidoglycan-binding domain-containing protein 4 n=1 Tax=Ficedula albicollis TaxID=59894 RepID=UPI00035A0907|nr:PREDICTED: lysM and putative peptidoglycan-binding domain-containing protein 4 [Ficedula albicollis]